MVPLVGCMQYLCEDDAFSGGSCKPYRDANGKCSASIVVRDGFNAYLSNCPAELFNSNTCICDIYIPCILSESRFGY